MSDKIPSFNPGSMYGGGSFIVTDNDGQLWRIDADKGTAETVKVINPAVLSDYMDGEKPVFIIWNPVRTRCQKIYANGKIEGFEPGSVISNHIGTAFQQVLNGGPKPDTVSALREVEEKATPTNAFQVMGERFGMKVKPIDPFAVIDEICARRGITHTELCRGAGIAPSTLNKAYKGGRQTAFHVRTLNKILEWDNAQP